MLRVQTSFRNYSKKSAYSFTFTFCIDDDGGEILMIVNMT